MSEDDHGDHDDHDAVMPDDVDEIEGEEQPDPGDADEGDGVGLDPVAEPMPTHPVVDDA